MTSVPSATTWGSPTATKHALLIHGLTSSSHTWHRVASLLAAQGYLITAPNLVGHGSRVSTDYRFSSIARDLRPYLEARTYSLIIGHSLGASTVLSLFPHLPTSHPTAIVLVDPPLKQSSEKLDFLDDMFTNSCINIKPAAAYAAEHPLWTCEDNFYMELGTRLCSVDAVHGMLRQNRPWDFFDCFDAVPEKWKVTVVAADPAVDTACSIKPYPYIRAVIVPGAGHWIQYEFPEVIVEEALKRIAELDVN
ncbi:Alpha/Beta hydrolase protein [Boletus edulis]|uniref:Alpha/Beta hydrolase protein n=1 Tax=Boletus edulis BED1 TaxID=1328754 RepID=A0AAD4GH31_BOLED|nr:Alpha/Beta hydrolase protein [Boletus edulis]KAF8442165.1 Alpha/Beta hydrolase protein [Boletus edulis BED1]